MTVRSGGNGTVRKGVHLIALAALLVMLASFPVRAAAQTPPATTATAASSYCADPEEAAMLKLINEYRSQNGLPALTLSPTLGAAAKHHSESMAQFNYFDAGHDLRFEGPNQDQTVTWQENIANFGYPDNTTTSRAENLAAGYETAAETLAQWQTSPSHNKHLLSDKYQAIGIGRATNPDSDYTWYWTVTFGSLADAEAQPCDTADGSQTSPLPVTAIPIMGSGRNGSSTESAVAYDGDPLTAWYTTKARTPVNGYVWFDLGEVQALTTIQYLFSDPDGASAFEIQVSTDKDEWTSIASLSNPPVGVWQTLEWNGKTRYVRFFFTNPDKVKTLGYLAEVRFFA